MPGVLCHPSRRELLNWLISEAEKSQLWVRKELAFMHTRHVSVHRKHVPSDSACNRAQQPRRGTRCQWAVARCPGTLVCLHPGMAAQSGGTSLESTGLVQAVLVPSAVHGKTGEMRLQRHCSHFTDEAAVAVKGCGQEPPFQVLGILVREHSSSHPPGTEVLLSGGSRTVWVPAGSEES